MVLSALFLSLGLVGVQSLPLEIRYILIMGLGLASWLFSGWALKEGLNGIEWVTSILPSVLFTIAVGMFYILLPAAWWARLLIAVVFAVGQYALLLTANIFSVAAIRTIALFRAASAVGFVMSLITGFFLFDTIFSFRMFFPLIGLSVATASFLLLLPALWSVELLPKISSRVASYSLWMAIFMGIVAMSIAFLPVSISVSALFLSTVLYVFLGIAQHQFADRLFARTVGEYVTVGVAVTITMLATVGWGV